MLPIYSQKAGIVAQRQQCGGGDGKNTDYPADDLRMRYDGHTSNDTVAPNVCKGSKAAISGPVLAYPGAAPSGLFLPSAFQV